MDPYAVLGVPKDADAKTIRRARQRKAKQLHPDRQGGNAEKMAECNLAFDILIDPVRRANFEQTGTTRVATEEEEARKLVMQGFMAGLTAPGRFNIPKRVLKSLEDSLGKVQELLHQCDQEEARVRERLGELQTKDRLDMWAGVVQSLLDGVEHKRAQVRREAAIVKLAIEIAKRYRSGIADSAVELYGPSFARWTSGTSTG